MDASKLQALRSRYAGSGGGGPRKDFSAFEALIGRKDPVVRVYGLRIPGLRWRVDSVRRRTGEVMLVRQDVQQGTIYRLTDISQCTIAPIITPRPVKIPTGPGHHERINPARLERDNAHLIRHDPCKGYPASWGTD